MADPLDVVTLAEVLEELGDVHDHDVLESYITSVSRLLDEACGPIVKRTVSDEAHDGGRDAVALNFWPISDVTTAVEYQGTVPVTLTEEMVTTAPSAGFLADYSTGELTRRAGKSDAWFAPGRRNVVVTYEAGRYETSSAVDARFKRAAMIALRNLVSKEMGMGTVTFGPDGQPIIGATFALPNAALGFIQNDLQTGWPGR